MATNNNILFVHGGWLADTCYSCEVPGEGEVTWNVTTMMRDAEQGVFGPPGRWKMSEMPEPDFESGNLDLAKIDRIMQDRSVVDRPALAIANAEGDIMYFCDGNHRLTARWKLKLPDFLCYRVPPSLERNYRITFDLQS